MTPTEELAYNYVKQNPGKTKGQVVAFLGGSWRNKYTLLQQMTMRGLIVTRMKKLYAVDRKK